MKTRSKTSNVPTKTKATKLRLKQRKITRVRRRKEPYDTTNPSRTRGRNRCPEPHPDESTMDNDPPHHDDSFSVDSEAVPPPTNYVPRGRTIRPSRGKRSWSDAEDQLLIAIMLELHGTGRYRADRGFKPGLYAACEKEFERRCPGCGIRADPHIYSRVKTLKSHFNIVSDMIHKNSSGFGWDDERKCVTADDPVWNDYLKQHKSAAQFRGKTFKYLDELTILFGTDRAQGTAAYDHEDILQSTYRTHVNANVTEVHGSDNVEAPSGRESGARYQSTNSAAVSGGRKRKSTNTESNDNSRYDEIRMMDKLLICADKMCAAMTFDALTSKKENLLAALRDIPTLSARSRYEAYTIICRDTDKLHFFYSLSQEEREEWVLDILSAP